MGQTPSKPQPGLKLQVIGAGLPRTGTTSLANALELLLNRPTYHGGTQIIMSPEPVVKSWNNMLRHTPIRTREDREVVMQTLEARFDGFAAAVDAPTPQFVAELLDLRPDAKVICTVRSRDKWVASMDHIRKKTKMRFLSWLLFPLPTLRYFPRFLTLLEDGRWSELYYRSSKDKWNWRVIWDRHVAYLERTVPEGQLLYFNVKDGWAPLCEFLDVPVPEGVEFPNINDGHAIDALAAKYTRQAIVAWSTITAATVIILKFIIQLRQI